MAKIYPDINKTRVVFASRAEEIFYEACRRALGGSWRVFYSCMLSSVASGAGLKDNEIDFVLYHPGLGVVIVEIKGGRIRYDVGSNNFFSVNRHGQNFSIKNPFAQVLSWKGRFLRLLKDKNIRVPVSQAVCFPNVSGSEFPKVAGIEPETIIDRDRIVDLEQTLRNLVRALQPEKYLRFDDVGDRIEELLVGKDFVTKLYIRDYIDSHEQRVLDVEGLQESFVTPVASSRRLGIEGEAGTGKTVLAANLAQHFRDRGQKVLLLSSNPILNVILRNLVGSGVTIKSYYELAESFGVDFSSVPQAFRAKREDWEQVEAPARLIQAIEQSRERYDVLICDEAQDIQPFWWDAVDKLVNTQNPENRFYVLFDRSQGIFGSGANEKTFIPEEVLPIQPPYFPLVHNYRTTREIGSFARAFRTGRQILESHSARLGYLPQVIVYEDEADAKRKLDLLVSSLVHKEHIKPQEITLLSARKPSAKPSVIADQTSLASIPMHQLGEALKTSAPTESVFKDGHIAVSTVGSFKGLETKVAILLNFSEYNMPLSNPIMASLFYVACTRAKHLLYVFVRKNDAKRQVVEATLRGIKQTGGPVIDPSDPDYELIGEIVHYNPDRIGWLTVDDPLFPKGNVMFFPSDVAKAKIGDVKVGDRIKFRPRVEGHATIASDLRRSS